MTAERRDVEREAVEVVLRLTVEEARRLKDDALAMHFVLCSVKDKLRAALSAASPPGEPSEEDGR